MFLPWELFKKYPNVHVKALFKIRQTWAIYKFQIIIPKKELKIFLLIMQWGFCKNTEFVWKQVFALGHMVITPLSPVVETIL